MRESGLILHLQHVVIISELSPVLPIRAARSEWVCSSDKCPVSTWLMKLLNSSIKPLAGIWGRPGCHRAQTVASMAMSLGSVVASRQAAPIHATY
jgi:hypothetical protein